MLEAFQVLDVVESTSGRIAKEQYLRQAPQDQLMMIFSWTYDPYRRYGVTVSVFDNTQCHDIGGDSNLSFLEFHELIERLSSRQLTGNAAREAVDEFLSSCCADDAFWYQRILNRDLRCGVNKSTIKKLFPGLLSSFDVQLCDKYYGEMLSEPHIIEPKLDGYRAIMMPDDDGFYTALSREGRELHNANHIIEEIRQKCLLDIPWVFDGELCGNDWNDTSSIVHTQGAHAKYRELKYHVFDAIPLVQFKMQRCDLTLQFRRSIIHNLFNDSQYIQLVPQYPISSIDEVYIKSRQLVQQGYEGGVLKSLNSCYEYDRTSAWRKVKFTETHDHQIIGAYEGTGKNIGRLGAFAIDVGGEEVKVGSGYSDEDRVNFWNAFHRGELLGTMIEVEFQEKTRDGSLRFPVFVRLRPDKTI